MSGAGNQSRTTDVARVRGRKEAPAVVATPIAAIAKTLLRRGVGRRSARTVKYKNAESWINSAVRMRRLLHHRKVLRPRTHLLLQPSCHHAADLQDVREIVGG